MKTKIVYIDEITGKEYNNRTEAEKAENKHREIKEMFKFWINGPEFGSHSFVQRDKKFYDKVMNTLEEAIKKLHPSIIKENELRDILEVKHG
jgi:stress-induced morphogen